MGGRGNFSTEEQRIVTHIFSTVGTIPNFEGDGVVKVILQNDINISSPTPTFCNTADTTYVALCPVVRNNKLIGVLADHVYYYNGHYLHKSVDINEDCGQHYHFWKFKDGYVERKKHQKSNLFFDLTDKDLYYIEKGRIFAEEQTKKILRDGQK